MLYLAIASLLIIAGITSLYFVKQSITRRKRRAAYPKDKVILHQFPRGIYAPTPSPFALKLETWLRMSGIPYQVKMLLQINNQQIIFIFIQNEFSIQLSKKGQIPWITLNNEDIGDSQFCIEYLSKKFDIDLNKHLTLEQKAIGRAFFKMTEESLKWYILELSVVTFIE